MLSTRRERACSPGAGQKEIDALLAEIDRPCRPEEDVRQRADLLHGILEEPRLQDRRGSDGRRVDGAAAHALVALGEPYASELTLAGLEALRATAPPRRADPEEVARPQKPLLWGLSWRHGAAALALGLWAQEVPTLRNGLPGAEDWVVVLALVLTAPSLLGPALLLLFKPRERVSLIYIWALLFVGLSMVALLGLAFLSMFFMGGDSWNRKISAFIDGSVTLALRRGWLWLCLLFAFLARDKPRVPKASARPRQSWAR